MFGPNKEERIQLASEARQMDFNREQTLQQTADSEDMTYLHQQRSDPDLIKWQQNLFDELEQLKHDLRNEYQNSQGDWVHKKDEFDMVLPPIANEMFINMIETECRPLMSRNMIMTNLDNKRILKILKNTADTIVDNMSDHWDGYGIEFTNFSHVLRMVKNVIIPAPFRALNDGERKHLRTFSKRIEAYSESPRHEPKKKLFGAWGGN